MIPQNIKKEYAELTSTNKMVFKKFLKADDIKKKQMIYILKYQLDNLTLLYNLMKQNIDENL